MANPIIALRIHPEVKAGLAIAAKRKFSSIPEYLRRVIADSVTRDGGLIEPQADEAARISGGADTAA
jgi:hypothetical protein